MTIDRGVQDEVGSAERILGDLLESLDCLRVCGGLRLLDARAPASLDGRARVVHVGSLGWSQEHRTELAIGSPDIRITRPSGWNRYLEAIRFVDEAILERRPVTDYDAIDRGISHRVFGHHAQGVAPDPQVHRGRPIAARHCGRSVAPDAESQEGGIAARYGQRGGPRGSSDRAADG